MSSITYNGITLALVETKSFDEQPVYTDDGAEYLYTKFTIDVSCVFSPDVMSGGASPTAIMNTVRQSLLVPRGILTFYVGFEKLLEVFSPDAKGGPFPQSCTIRQIHGTATFLVEWSCIAYGTSCEYGNNQAISNRWSMTMSYDENLFCTRTTSGQIIIQAQAVGVPPDLDQFRRLAIPTLPEGWQRERIQFDYARDGLSLAYQITDREKDNVAPRPATTARGTYTEVSSSMGGKLHAEMSVTLGGFKGTPRINLVAIAAQIILSRVREGDIIEQFETSEELFDNQISMRARWLKIPDNIKVLDANMMIDGSKFGIGVPGTDSPAVDINDRTGLLSAAISAFKGVNYVCNIAGGIPDVIPFNQTLGETTINSTVVDSPQSSLGSKGSPKISPNENKMYTDSQVNMEYMDNANNVHLPDASSFGGSAVVTLGAYQQTIKVKYRSERYGKWPQSPSASVQAGMYVLRDSKVVETPQLTPDGLTFIYAIHGEMEIAATSRFTEATGYQAGKLPNSFGAETIVPGGSGVWVTDILGLS